MESHALRPTKSADPGFIRTSDDVNLFYRSWGKGRPVVFLAGWTLSSDMWAYQMVPMSEAGLRCVAYDRRGHGRSSDPGRGYDFDTLSDDLATVLDALDLQQVTFVAHSMASGEVVRYLSRHGSTRVSSVALVAPAATPFLLKTPDNPDGIDEQFFDEWRGRILRDFPQWIDDNSAPYFVPETGPGIIDWTKRTMLQTSLQAAADCTRAMSTTDFRPELAQVAVPVLVIHGDKDASAPIELTGRRTAKAIPGATLQVYEGAPHGLYVTHRDRLNRDLLAFLQRPA